MSRSTPPLWDRFLRPHGRVHLTGLEALVRISLDQVRRDRAAGHRVSAFYSGYPGSPLAGLDQLLNVVRPLLDAEHVRFVPGLNEELAASAVAGTQLLDLFPHAEHDGVIGLWFGKAPGLDRALDAIRHANYQGISRHGAAVALVGDDPGCKSSTLPSHSEYALAHAAVPVLYPADAAEIVELGRHAFALSRYAGTWVALKIVADVADAGMIVDLPADPWTPQLPKFEVAGRAFQKRFDPRLLPPAVQRIEEDLLYARLEAVRRYAEANGLNPIEERHAHDRIGLVASGRLYRELRTALERLGLDAAGLERLGIRILRVQLVYPLEPRRIAEFAQGLDEIVVIDERRGFLEEQLRAVLFNEIDRPRVLGQHDARGAPWLARHEEICAETLALDLAPHLAELTHESGLPLRTQPLLRHDAHAMLPLVSRQPHFCSGCPHSTSTQLPEGARAGGGIGCHTLALNMDRGVEFIGAMGSEGAPWIGLSPYTETKHLFQNLGDGTYCHSARLAVRAAVEARVSLTYKLLYNGYIAMTGGQRAVGMKPVAEIVRDLLGDGVSRVVAVSTDVTLAAMAEHDGRLELIPRERYAAAMRELQDVRGVTCLVYDQVCSNQKHRLEKRGLRARSAERILIDQDVCEGCGDCGRKTSCLSLWPVETALGRKTRLHTGSCTDDRACLAGDCPAFVSAELPEVPAGLREELLALEMPEPVPARLSDGRFEIYLVGIGSTGVVTANSTLVRAAEIEGIHALHLDQTGLAQRGGRVTSHCVLSKIPLRGSPRVGWGRADVVIALDPLASLDSATLRSLDPARSAVVFHDTLQPTARMVADPSVDVPQPADLASELRGRCRAVERVRAEELATVVLGGPQAANVVLLGAALQHGLLPVTLSSVECAIHDRGVAVDANLLALRLGRAAVARPDDTRRWLDDSKPPSIGDGGDTRRAAELLGTAWSELESLLGKASARAKRDSLAQRCAALALDLIEYQSPEYALRYLARVTRIARAELALAEDGLELTATVCRELYRVMAYKDEYEVARLLLTGPFRRWLDRRSGGRARLHYHLHPPLLRRLGLQRKLVLGRAIEPVLALMMRLRSLRGTKLDPFGFLPDRRAERAFLVDYEAAIDRVAAGLSRDNLHDALAIAAASQDLRGYESIKRGREKAVRARIDAKLARF